MLPNVNIAACAFLLIASTTQGAEKVHLVIERQILTVTDKDTLTELAKIHEEMRFRTSDVASERLYRLARSKSIDVKSVNWEAKISPSERIDVPERSVLGIIKVEGEIQPAPNDTHQVDITVHLFDRRDQDGGGRSSFFGIQSAVRSDRPSYFPGDIRFDVRSESCRLTFFRLTMTPDK